MLVAGGLHIVGTERHESRRIDNQLRGRSGRQGDPGSSRFYLSMEDNLMRIFGDPLRTQRLLKMAGMKEGEVIESGMLTRQIEKAQRKVESHNFDIRKNLLLFDDVANDQRKVVYSQRTEIMGTEDLSGAIHGLLEDSVGTLMDQYMPKQAVPADWDMDALSEALAKDFGTRVDPKAWLAAEPDLEEQALRERIVKAVSDAYDAKVARTGAQVMRHVEKQVMLQKLDHHWREHLAAMDYLRQGIHLRGYAQKDYRFEFKREAFELFCRDARSHQVRDRLLDGQTSRCAPRKTSSARKRSAASDSCGRCRRSMPRPRTCSWPGAEEPSATPPAQAPAALRGPGARAGAPQPLPDSAPAGTFVRNERKVGRNEPCPCGSGKKFKHCHGVLSSVE